MEKGYLDAQTWDQVQAAALAVFQRGQAVARQAGLILVDTKYEFGRAPDGRVLLIDEVHTPDSSRFWQAAAIRNVLPPDRSLRTMTKSSSASPMLARATAAMARSHPCPPACGWQPASAISAIYEMLTGQTFAAGDYPVEPRLETNLQRAGLL